MKKNKTNKLSISKFRLLFTVFLLYICFSCQRTNNKNSFASIEEDTMEVNIDTTAFKKFLETNLLSKQNIKLNTIQVKKQKALGSGEVFYYVYAATKDKKIKVARWLNKRENELYLNDELPDEGVLFEQSYLVCKGTGKCAPQLYKNGDERMWGCTTVVACYAGKKNPYPDCDWSMNYIEPSK